MRINHLYQAYVNLLAAKLRSFLAVLGILVGTGAVVALMNCGKLATDNALAQFKKLGTNLLAINIFSNYTPGKSQADNSIIPLSLWRDLKHKVPGILSIAPYGSTYHPMSFEGTPLQGSVVGADETLQPILNITLKQGSFVSFLHQYERYCVIGEMIANRIKTVTLKSPLGQQLKIGNQYYSIIGEMNAHPDNAFFNDDVNQSVIIPIQGLIVLNKDAKINNAIVRLKSPNELNKVTTQLKQTLEEAAPSSNIMIRSAKQIIDSMESQGKIFTLLLGIIGGVSLLVGGIGVMNVMLVSVSERKREIGIRKAVGATRKHITTLFLTEAIYLSLVGGTLGIVLGLVFTRIICYFTHWTFIWYTLPPISGFGVSVFTGLFFGYYPAKRAANLTPVACLRQD